MINPEAAFRRFAKKLKERSGIFHMDQLRPLTFTQTFDLVGAAQPLDLTTAPEQMLPQQFPAGALVLGVQASSMPQGQPVNPFLQALERFRMRMTYNTSDGLVTDFGIGSALLGREGDKFPQEALFLEANQVIQQRIQNITPERLIVTVAYHCLVWRFAQ